MLVGDGEEGSGLLGGGGSKAPVLVMRNAVVEEACRGRCSASSSSSSRVSSRGDSVSD
jgi:hypothetical protein